MNLGALVSWSCYNRVPQTWWLKQQIHSVTILEARNPKSRCWQEEFLLRAVTENLFQAPGSLRHSLAYRRLSSSYVFTSASLSMCLSLCPNFPIL